MLEQCCNHSKQCRNNAVMLCCANNRCCESSRATYLYALSKHNETPPFMILCVTDNSPLSKREENWAELTFAKTPGTVTKDREGGKIGQ